MKTPTKSSTRFNRKDLIVVALNITLTIHIQTADQGQCKNLSSLDMPMSKVTNALCLESQSVLLYLALIVGVTVFLISLYTICKFSKAALVH